ncbi:MAG: sulfatase-like hydrolase/transferase [Tannerellaceae bacterium]|jgi:phosphoglycerol transferase MdoB-like AlkP superfamily enzyme|nr:sulfatase-like hydrolase/transferase [Tannerellaceae bacterium]
MKTFTAVLRYLLSVHCLGIACFIIFRSVLCLTNTDNIADAENKGYLFFRAFLVSLQFDNFIASYISFLPLLLLSIPALFNKIPRSMVTACNIFFIVFYAVAFTVSAADIPYFSYFFNHPDASALNWFEFGQETAGLIFQEKSYYPYFLLLAAMIAIFSFTVIRSGKRLVPAKAGGLQNMRLYITAPLILLTWCICFAGMRGSFQRYPLRVGYAYFSNNSFFNQLGINPTFYFLKSFSANSNSKNNANDLMSVETAIQNVQTELGIVSNDEKYPVNRNVETEGKAVNANVVIILMESASTVHLQYEYEGKKLMPFLNELISISYYFENFYSSGIHTNNGIVSTLYAFPALFNKPMMESQSAHYTGLPYHLKQQGYRNLFFVTSNPNYDHMNSFLMDNYFDRIYSLYDYPEEKAVNNFGVQDDFMLEYGIQRLNETAGKGEPFLATFLTVSNHTPLIVPEKFRDYADTDEKRMLAFVDNNIRNFMESASREQWYQNTIFVILGDHGTVAGPQKYDMSVSNNHIPCIIYSPLLRDMPQRFHQYGGQIDIFPTIMGLLNSPYTNNSPGIDLLREKRSRMFFASDNRLGCISDEYFYVRNLTGNSDFLYNRNSSNAENLYENHPDIAAGMKNYAVSMMVTADYLIKNNRTR